MKKKISLQKKSHQQDRQDTDRPDRRQTDPERKLYISKYPFQSGERHKIHAVQFSYHCVLICAVDIEQDAFSLRQSGQKVQQLISFLCVPEPDLLPVVFRDPEDRPAYLPHGKNAGLIFRRRLFQDRTDHFFPALEVCLVCICIDPHCRKPV